MFLPPLSLFNSTEDEVTGCYLFIIQEMRVSFSRCLCNASAQKFVGLLGMLWITKLSRVQLYLIEAVVFIWSIYEAGRNGLPKSAAGRALCWTQGWKTALFLYLSYDDGMLRFSNYHPSTLKGLFDRSCCEGSCAFWNVVIMLKYVSLVFGGHCTFVIIQNGD